MKKLLIKNPSDKVGHRIYKCVKNLLRDQILLDPDFVPTFPFPFFTLKLFSSLSFPDPFLPFFRGFVKSR